MSDPSTAYGLRGLIVDWGGVLTTSLEESTVAWADADDIDLGVFREVMRGWLGTAGGEEARWNPVHALERGEMEVPDFEIRLAQELRTRSGVRVPARGLLQRMFAFYEHAPDMVGLLHRAHAAGIRTALLSNSWGNDYPRDGWTDMFDAVVISGEVGMRKPESRIYQHTIDLIGLPARECVFVDDLPPNIAAAVDLGMVGILHESYAATAAELEVLFTAQLAT